MAEMAPAQDPQAECSFDVKYMVDGKHSTMLLLPEAFHALIGRVIAYWGNFEVVFDSCLGGLLAGESADGKAREATNWKRQSFRLRRKLFQGICNEWLATWQPTAANELLRILETAATLHPKRNLIAHDTYGYTIPPYSSVATNCYAYSHSTGEKLHFDEEVLKKLYHDVSHLTADLIQAFRSFGQIEGPHHLIPDAEVLRIYRDSVHPWNPDPSKRPNAG